MSCTPCCVFQPSAARSDAAHLRAGDPSNGGAAAGSLLAIFEAIPIMAFAYQCHVQAVPIFHELDEQPSLLLPWHRAAVPLDLPAMRAGKPANRASLDIETAHIYAPANGRGVPLAHSRADAGSASLRSRSADLAAAPASPQHGSATVAPPPSSGSGAAGAASPRALHAPVPAAKLRGMMQVLAVAYIMCTVLYEATGIAGYHLFGDAAASNVLNNFSVRDTLMQLVNTLVGLAGAPLASACRVHQSLAHLFGGHRRIRLAVNRNHFAGSCMVRGSFQALTRLPASFLGDTSKAFC